MPRSTIGNAVCRIPGRLYARPAPGGFALVGTLAVLLLTGCGDGTGEPGGFVHSDSAGIWIAESTAPAWGPGEGWTLEPSPALQIGSVDGEPIYQFTRVLQVIELPDRRLVVADPQSPEGAVRLYDSDGTYLDSALPRGEGPREATSLRWIGTLPEGGVAAWDSGLQRLSVLDVEGSSLAWRDSHPLVLSHPDPPEPEPGTQLMLSTAADPVGIFSDGSMLVLPAKILGGRFGERLRTVRTLHRWDAEGELIGPVMEVPAAELTVPDPTTGVSTLPPTPFPGRFVVAVAGDRIYHGADTEGYVIRVLAPDGELEGLIRRPSVDLEVTPALRDAWRRQQLDDAESDAEREAFEEQSARLIFPVTRAPFRQIRVDPLGHLWVRDESIPGDDGPGQWQIFDPRGRHLGGIEVPDHFVLRQVAEDHVVGVWTDDFDVPYVRRYALIR